MSEEQIEAIYQHACENEQLRALVAALEARLREAGEQKPVEYRVESGKGTTRRFMNYDSTKTYRDEGWTVTPLYAAPVPAQPVAENPIGFISNYALAELNAGRWPTTQIVTCADNSDGLSGNNAIYLSAQPTPR